jgi:hypothetical protein
MHDGEELRTVLLTGLLERDYAICAWLDRWLFQPNDYRIQRIVETYLTQAVLTSSPHNLNCVLTAIQHHVDAREMRAERGSVCATT